MILKEILSLNMSQVGDEEEEKKNLPAKNPTAFEISKCLQSRPPALPLWKTLGNENNSPFMR